MKQSQKLFFDILIGAVIPILILNNLTKTLGGPTAYVIAALIPVAWVLVDLFLISRTFNFITSYTGLTAIMQGILAFWFVDGFLFAIKDSAALIATLLVFSISVLIDRPVLQLFFRQVIGADTPERLQSLAELYAIPAIRRAFRLGTWIVVAQSLISTIINLQLNLQMVKASFGSELFNQQVASVNTITRVIFPILSIIGFALGIWLVYRALYQHLPSEEGKPQLESDFWDLVALRKQGSPEA